MSREPRIGERIRTLLLGQSDGMTVRQIAKAIDSTQDLVDVALRRNFGFYVEGWDSSESRKGLTAVWQCVQVPDSVPMPKGEIDADALSITVEQRNKALKAMREKQKEINAKLRAKRDADRQAARELKEKIRAEVAAVKAEEKAAVEVRKLERLKARMQPAAPADYQPAKTRWVTPPPWSH
jgi:outer membrane autotransporter protein